jgi:hypothetical protein
LLLAACAGRQARKDGPPPAWHVSTSGCANEASAADTERVMQSTADRRAATVFAYAECERKRLDAETVTKNDLPTYAEDVRRTRALYWEAYHTHESRWEIGAMTGIGDLYSVAAERLEKLDARANASKLSDEAAQAYQWAVIHADGAPADVLADTQVAGWLSDACTHLTRLANEKNEAFDVSMCKQP